MFFLYNKNSYFFTWLQCLHCGFLFTHKIVRLFAVFHYLLKGCRHGFPGFRSQRANDFTGDTGSGYFFAEISVTSPRKLVIFIIGKNLFWIIASKKWFFYLNLKTVALDRPKQKDPVSSHSAQLWNTVINLLKTANKHVEFVSIEIKGSANTAA